MEQHGCTGTDCAFCLWRQAYPIEHGWESLLVPQCATETDNFSLDFALSAQQTFDFVADLNIDDFPTVDATVQQVLAEAEVDTPKDALPSPSPTFKVGASNHIYDLPKSDRAV